MPLLDSPDLLELPAGYGFMPETFPEREYTGLELLGASMRLGNSVASILANPAARPKAGFDPIPLIPKGYEEFAGRFMFAGSTQQIDRIRKGIDDERQAEEIRAAGGPLTILTDLAAGVLDPINLFIPGGEAVTGFKAGQSILKGAGRAALMGTSAAVLTETALQASQATRTMEDSLWNIGGTTVLSGLLGGLGSAMSRNVLKGKSFEKLGKQIEDDLVVPLDRNVDPVVPNNRLKDEDWIAKIPIVNRQDPMIRTLLSPSTVTREIVQSLAETPLKFEKNLQGIATTLPAEALARQYRAPLAFALKALDEAFLEYRTGGGGNKLLVETGDLLGQSGGKLSWQEFKNAVGQAMRQADQSSISQVAKAAQAMRQMVFDPMKDEAIRLGLLPEDVMPETALTYLTRVWDVEKIVARRDEFLDRNLKWLLEKEAQRPLAEQRTREQLEDIADRLIDRILGTPEGRLGYEANLTGLEDVVELQRKGRGAGAAKPLHKRVYDIPDSRVEDFLVNDVEHVAKLYERSLGPDLALVAQYGKTDLDEIVSTFEDAITKDYAALQKKATSAKERKTLEAQKQSDLRDISAIFQRIRGTYGLPKDPSSMFVRTGRVLRNLNYAALMGGVAVSSLPDLARPMMVHGVKRYLEDGLRPLVSSVKAVKLTALETQQAAVALDTILDSRMMSFGELMDDYGRGSVFERGLSMATGMLTKASGIDSWTAFGKQFSGMITQARILDATEAVANNTINQKELGALAASYIDREMAGRIADQFAKYGDVVDGVKIANTEKWVDQTAVRHFRAAVARDVERIIVTPGQEKPLWMSNELGKLLGQFRSFFISSTQRVLLSGLQDRDLGVLSGFVFATGLGVMTTLIQAKLTGRTLSNNPADLLLEGVDRSGVMGWFFEANNMVEKATRGTYGLSAMTGKPAMSRYAGRNTVDALLGPSVGRVEDAVRIAGSLSAGDLNEGDIRAMRRLIPFQNLFYLRGLFDAGEAGLRDAIGLEDEKPFAE